jgi:hypothetical protein
MEARAAESDRAVAYPVTVDVRPATEDRNRLTAAFRFFLALPHLVLVGGPVAVIVSVSWRSEGGASLGYGSVGLLGFVIAVVTAVAWLAILLVGRHPDRLRDLAEAYLRWRVRAISYMTLLRDEYPPFGAGAYPVELVLPRPEAPRERLTVAFRFFLAIPHMIVLWLLSMAWAIATAIAWVMILVTGRYPETLYGFAIGVLSWSVRVEAYLLLLRDEYPPFTLRA